MPLVSVIVPAYNAEKTIRETIESVLNQTFTDFELIIVNDGSTDKTLEVISQIDDPRLKVFYYPNAGSSASRNRGVSHAVSQYISFIDADDMWTSDKLEAQLEAIQKEPQAAVAYSWTDFIDQSSKFVERDQREIFNGNVYQEILVRCFINSGSNILAPRQAFQEVGSCDETLRGAIDWDLYIRLAARYPFVAVPRVGILYRIGSSSSISSNLLRQEKECLRVIDKSFDQAPETLQYLKKKSLANLYQYLCFKAIDGSYTRDRAWLAARYYWRALKLDPSVFKHRIGINFRVYLKILAALTLPPQLTQRLVDTWRSYYEHSLTNSRSNQKSLTTD